jgi:hypothetical protein
MRHLVNRSAVLGAAVWACLVGGCGATATGGAGAPPPAPRSAPAPTSAAGAGAGADHGAQFGAGPDTIGTGLIPAGYGTLRQDDISIKLTLEGVLVQLLPMNESVIRTLSPDAYRSLHGLRQSYAAQISAYASQYGLRDDNVWYVSFYGMAPDATFSPLDLVIRAPGRDFTPLRVIPITPGFGSNRLQVRDVQSAFYLFDDGLPLSQPLTVSMAGVTDDSWQTTIRKIEAEQAHVRARAARAPGNSGALRGLDEVSIQEREP